MPCRSQDHAAARLGTSARSSLVVVIVVGGSAEGERLRRQLLGAEAVMEEAAAVVIMTCFVVGCGCMFCDFGLVWCDVMCVLVNNLAPKLKLPSGHLCNK